VVASSILTPVLISGKKYSFRYRVSELVIKTSDDLVIFDTGFPGGNELINALKGLSLDPDDFTHVFNTHIHIDHFGGNGLFRKAKIILSRKDYHFNKRWNEEFEVSRDRTGFVEASFRGLNRGQAERITDMLTAVMVDHAGNSLAEYEHRFRFIEDYPLIPDFVEIIETPGHTPFHVSYKIAGKKRSAFMLGDLIPGKKSFYGGKDNFIEIYSDRKRASESLDTVKRLARESSGAVIHPSHDRPFYFGEGSYLAQSSYEL
jgi:glyoxylase-like metal-dependent hydrolase (beta-lactamase superfamily II)